MKNSTKQTPSRKMTFLEYLRSLVSLCLIWFEHRKNLRHGLDEDRRSDDGFRRGIQTTDSDDGFRRRTIWIWKWADEPKSARRFLVHLKSVTILTFPKLRVNIFIASNCSVKCSVSIVIRFHLLLLQGRIYRDYHLFVQPIRAHSFWQLLCSDQVHSGKIDQRRCTNKAQIQIPIRSAWSASVGTLAVLTFLTLIGKYLKNYPVEKFSQNFSLTNRFLENSSSTFS